MIRRVGLPLQAMTVRFKQPNSDDCFVCGRKNPVGLYMTFYHDGERKVFSEVTIPEHFQGYPGVVHGGGDGRHS